MNSTIEVYDKMAKWWGQTYFERPFIKALNKYLNFLGRNGKVLDIGCGSGQDVKYFIEHGIDVIGIDLSDEMLKEAKVRVPEGKFIKMDLTNLEFNDDFFDGVWASASLLHVKKSEILNILNKINVIMKKYGILFVSVKEGTGESIDKTGRFFAYYSDKELEELLTSSGFMILETLKGNTGGTKWINIFAKKK